MSTSIFCPPDTIQIFCRFCHRVIPAQLDKAIADRGKIVDRSSTFEYVCTKCHKSFCLNGNSFVDAHEQSDNNMQLREYNPRRQYYIGERIVHKKFEDYGIVVGIDQGATTKILVKFEKVGLKRLVTAI